MDFKELTAEQKEKAKACETPEEILKLAREEGCELSEEELDGISGGKWGETCTDHSQCGVPFWR